ncbi:MAG: hypothetical protein QXE96_00905 [Candidatus Caldarchaeum sp.]
MSSQSGSAPERLIDDSGASTAGPAVGDKDQGAKRGKRFYCDIHRKKDDSGYRITYTTDGENFRHVDSPVEIPVGPGDKVYVDTIPIIHTDGFIELLRRGAEVYYLRRLTLIEKMRQRLGIKLKSAKADIKILMTIDEKWFKRVDENFLIMRQLLSSFRSVEKNKRRLENQLKAASQATKESLKRLVDHAEEEKLTIARQITEEAGRRYPAYNTLVEKLKISGENHLLAKEALAEILIYVTPNWGLRKTTNFFGLYKNTNKKKKKLYNGHARKALERLTIAVYNINKDLTAKLQKQLLKQIWLTIRREAQERLAGIPAQQQG